MNSITVINCAPWDEPQSPTVYAPADVEIVISPDLNSAGWYTVQVIARVTGEHTAECPGVSLVG